MKAGNKITVIGGAGAMAKAVIKDMVESKDISEIVIAARNGKEANRFANELKSKPETKAKLSAVALDVYDHDKLVETIKDSDAVIDATHQSCGFTVAKGVVDAKVNGCALGSHYVYAKEIIEKLDKLAKDAGITYLVSAGAMGATGIMAKYLANKMDEAEEVHISMPIFRPIALSPALVDLFVSEMISTATLIYEDGVLKKMPPFSGKEEIEYPEPFGKQIVYYFTSCDPLTLPMAIKGLKNVYCKVTYYPDYTEMLKTCCDVGFCSATPIEVGGQEIIPKDVFKELLIRRPVEKGREMVKFAIRVKVRGEKDGWKVERILYTPFLPFEGEKEGPETRATGEPGSIIVQMMARGNMKEKGVMGPESCIEPNEFMAEWSKRRGVEIYESCIENRKM